MEWKKPVIEILFIYKVYESFYRMINARNEAPPRIILSVRPCLSEMTVSSLSIYPPRNILQTPKLALSFFFTYDHQTERGSK